MHDFFLHLIKNERGGIFRLLVTSELGLVLGNIVFFSFFPSDREHLHHCHVCAFSGEREQAGD